MNYLQSRIGNLESVRRHRRTMIVWRNHDEAPEQATARWRAANPGEDQGAHIMVVGWGDPTAAAEQQAATNGGRGGPFEAQRKAIEVAELETRSTALEKERNR